MTQPPPIIPGRPAELPAPEPQPPATVQTRPSQGWFSSLHPALQSIVIIVPALQIIGVLFALGNRDETTPTAEPTQAVPAVLATPASVAPPATTTTTPPPPTPRATPEWPIVGPAGPGYVVSSAWPADDYGSRAGVQLMISPANESTARKAIAHYFKNYTKGLSYLWVETVGHTDTGSWICAGAYLTKAGQDHIFDDGPQPSRYPATIVRCNNETPDSDVYYANCSEARAAGAAPLYRGDPGYRSGLDRDGDGVACE
jgi:hypothetical protein